ncbi:MAG TPA: HDOD domain-containing protein [Verrucomicrobiae bacterium]|nr:HDOD domain-containing protein [Verrucomicrobiae bacterium]
MDGGVTDKSHSSAHEQAIAALLRLPPLSAVAVQVQLLAGETLELAEVAEMITADAALSADVLRLVNSSLFGMRRPATGILHAVALLGLNRVMTLVVTAALRSYASPAHGTAALKRCWRHNLGCGLICEKLANTVDLDPDVAYTAGLLHDIGRCGMLGVWTAHYGNLLDTAAPDPQALLASEEEELGITHTAAGAFLLETWHLPETLIEVARRHHDPPAPDVTDYIGLAHCACALADQFGFGVTGAPGDVEGKVDVPQPWRGLVDGLPEDFGFTVAERINALELHLLPG